MARYQHLPIYKQTYDMMIVMMNTIKTFPRDFKFTMGQDLKHETLSLTTEIYRANSATNKTPHIETIIEKIQVLEFQIRLCVDLRLISKKQYASLIELTSSLLRQAEGWKKSVNK